MKKPHIIILACNFAAHTTVRYIHAVVKYKAGSIIIDRKFLLAFVPNIPMQAGLGQFQSCAILRIYRVIAPDNRLAYDTIDGFDENGQSIADLFPGNRLRNYLHHDYKGGLNKLKKR